MYTLIKRKIIQKFEGIEELLKEEDLYVGSKKTVLIKNWLLKWVIQEDEKGLYMEYYAIHEKRGHLHGRVYSDGKEEYLEVLKQYIAYAPNIPGDREKSAKAFENYNRRLMGELQYKGLM